MSERDLLLRESALSALISSFSKTLAQAEKRSRWPGTTQSAENPSKILAVQLWPTVIWEVVTALTLDPGRWLLVGQGSFQVGDVSGSQVITQMRLAESDDASSREAFVYSDQVSIRPFYQIQCTVQSATEFTVTLEAAQSSTNTVLPGFRSGEVLGGAMIAYPL